MAGLGLPRSAVPTSILASRLKNTINVEALGGLTFTVLTSDRVLILTRTTYRSNYKALIRPSPKHPYVMRLAKIISSGGGGGVVTTAEIYGMLADIIAARGFKPVRVRLDTEKAVEELLGIGLEKPAVLRKHLHNILGLDDGEDLYQAVRTTLQGGARYSNRQLVISLGMKDEARRRGAEAAL